MMMKINLMPKPKNKKFTMTPAHWKFVRVFGYIIAIFVLISILLMSFQHYFENSKFASIPYKDIKIISKGRISLGHQGISDYTIFILRGNEYIVFTRPGHAAAFQVIKID